MELELANVTMSAKIGELSLMGVDTTALQVHRIAVTTLYIRYASARLLGAGRSAQRC